MEQGYNLRKIYEGIKVPEDFEVNYAATVCNFRVFEAALHILNGEVPYYGELIYDCLTLAKYTLEKMNESVDDYFVETANTVQDFVDMCSNGYTCQDYCLAIGTSSDSGEHISVRARFMIMLATAIVSGIKIEF